MYYRWENIKKWSNYNEFKVSAPTCNDTFELPDASYSISDIQGYFEYVQKNQKKILIILQW